jgi:hypothetical protein
LDEVWLIRLDGDLAGRYRLFDRPIRVNQVSLLTYRGEIVEGMDPIAVAG